ncbi:uncharacterized protein GGS25DRAFT_126397 [Hypoxylon fragiforme]|uniref:uncharacterized protein n=1 Tax=Hypoxylon fragiforme TaxID=63214 RepID=UPI0020C63080|nr:uncharacterized protein GGS25DRAFT_126397 [Hypoxylon fragiforme]KAI2612609.1 hypothetical protein GGS25DRAFT_126397 [Hypoxylon fragiforme]
MARSRHFAIALGTIALLATAATLALEAIIAYGSWAIDSSVKTAAVVASAWQSLMLILLTTFLSRCFKRTTEYGQRKANGVWFALGLIASLLASTASVVMLVLMRKKEELLNKILQIPSSTFLVGSAIALVCAFLGQLIFIVVFFVTHRLPDSEQALSLHTNEDSPRFPPVFGKVKSIPYTRTAPPAEPKSNQPSLLDYSSRPGSNSGHSMAETMSSIRTSISHVVRPAGSRTRLLPSTPKSGSGLRSGSIDSNGYRERSSVTEEGFDSWDTSSVDPQNRQIVADSSPPSRARFLETIPASPTTSRSPSPGCPLDLDPPRLNRRSRSYSPLPKAHHERSVTPQLTPSELHIHPLFRSDSPVPPPAATPGTVVIAAPNAGTIISERSLTRMRSGSLPTGPGPLSRQASYDSFRKTPSPNTDRLRAEDLAAERKMTPPIPDWILNSGSKTSLAETPTQGVRDGEAAKDLGNIN